MVEGVLDLTLDPLLLALIELNLHLGGRDRAGDALQTAVYDPKKYDDTRLDDGTSDIDSLDAFEYCLEPWYQQLLRYGEKPYQSILRR